MNDLLRAGFRLIILTISFKGTKNLLNGMSAVI